MNKVNAVMVGGLFDENGISAFARPVLFGTAGDAMRDALPDAVETCFFAHDDRANTISSLAAGRSNNKVPFLNRSVITIVVGYLNHTEPAQCQPPTVLISRAGWRQTHPNQTNIIRQPHGGQAAYNPSRGI